MFSQRWIRLPWVLGALIVVVSIIGAGQMFQTARPVEAGPRDTRAAIVDSVGTGVICLGRVDVEPGLIRLFPHQPGAVTDVFCSEGQQVKKGDPLLKVLDMQFRHQLAAAEEAVNIAEAQVAQAQQFVARYPETISAQEHVIGSTRAFLAVARANVDRGERLAKANIPQMSNEEFRALQETAKAAEEKVAAEEAKLRELKKANPQDKVIEAQRNVDLQKKKVDQAREALDRCTLSAPVDGTVLQIQATLGSQFSTQSHTPAMILAPNGPRIVRLEVDQEFAGRISMGASVQLQDESNVGPTWNGKVVRIAEAYLPKRSAISGPEVITSNSETRPLEVIVTIDPASSTLPRLGQKMRGSVGSAASPIAMTPRPGS